MADIELIVRLYESGLETTQIGKQLGLRCGTVLYHLKRRGVRIRKARIDWPVEQMRQWYEQEGLTLQQIADRLNQSQKLVNKVAKKHGFQMRRRGPKSGAEHPDWKGGRTIDKAGYILVYQPDHPNSNGHGYIREHRLIMSQMLGRHLEKGEVVHHIDGDPQNNSPENLQLYATNGVHLAETRKGQIPNWTPDGKRRILEAIRRPRTRKAKNRAQPTSNDQQTQ